MSISKQALDLLETLISDPSGIKKRVEEFVSAKKAHDETLQKVKQAQADAEQKLDDAHRISSEGHAAAAKAAATSAQLVKKEAELKERERHLEERHKEFSEHKAHLDVHQAALRSDMDKHASEKAAWTKHVSERESALDKKTKEVNEAYSRLRAILPG